MTEPKILVEFRAMRDEMSAAKHYRQIAHDSAAVCESDDEEWMGATCIDCGRLFIASASMTTGETWRDEVAECSRKFAALPEGHKDARAQLK